MAIKLHPKHSGRKIVTRSKTTYKSLSKSSKTGYVQQHESRVQHKWSLVFDWDDEVLKHYEEPEGFEFEYEGEPSAYFPDFMLYMKNGEIDYIEIKPKRQLMKPLVQERLKVIGDYIQCLGFGFRVLTEQDLPFGQIGLSNLRRLKWIKLDHKKTKVELQKYLPCGDTTFANLTEEVGSQKLVMALMAEKYLNFDISAPICNTTVLTVNKEKIYV